MQLTRRLMLLSLLLAAFALVLAYGVGGNLRGALILAAIGGVCLGGQWAAVPRLRWLPSLVLLLYTGAAGLGMLLALPPGWMLLGLIGALAAWDLAYFNRRVRGVEGAEADRRLERQHLERLGIVLGLGALAAGGALLVQARLTLGVGILVALLALLALTQVIGFLRRESD